jgi:hypothetical protein
MGKYEALSTRVAEWTESIEGKAVIRKGKAFGRKVKVERFAAAPGIAAERESGTTKDVLADEYGMSTGSVGNYANMGLLVIADPGVDRQAAYTYVTKNEGAPNLAEIREACEAFITAPTSNNVLSMLVKIVDARIAADQTPGDPDEGGESDEVEGDEVEDKTATYYAQATDALANILNKGNAASLTLDEANVLAAQVAEITRLIRAAQPKAA